jgi:RNA polymerase sigma-70 factor (ECF subfamily)
MSSSADRDQPVSFPASLTSPQVMNASVATPVPALSAFAADPADAMSLLAREEGALRRVMQRYVRDASSVDDVFQEVSLKVLKRLDSVRDPAALRGWLFQLARNACLDHLRREDRRQGLSHEVLADHSAGGDLGRNPTEQFLSRERISAVRRALDRLPESQREVIRLRIEEGLDHLAIAERLGISRQAVEVRLCRGRAALKTQLDGILGGEL